MIPFDLRQLVLIPLDNLIAKGDAGMAPKEMDTWKAERLFWETATEGELQRLASYLPKEK